MLISKHPRY